MFSRLVLIATTLTLSTFCATELTTYRSFHFGESPTVAGKQPGIRLADMRTMQKRPAMIQELDWRPEMSYQGNSKGVDPVRDGVLRFYNGELFQIVTTYNRDKVEGMTDADMITALSATYGVASSPSVEIPFHSNYGETAKVIARWGNDDYEYDLVRTGDQASFALVLSMKRLEKLAQISIVEAARLDAIEAPQRALDAQKKLDADNRLLINKARAANILNFIP